MKFLLFSIALIFTLDFSIAQTRPHKGYVVLSNGDSLKGYIDYRIWGENPKTLNFHRDSLSEEVITYGMPEVNSFVIYGEARYIKAAVKKDVRPVKGNEEDLWSAENPNAYQDDIVFLRVLADGTKLSLYELVDDKFHYYINAPDGGYEELIYSLTRDDGAVLEKRYYRNRLSFLGGNDKRVNVMAASANYIEKDLKKIVATINKNAGNEPWLAPYPHKIETRSYILSGLIITNFSHQRSEQELGETVEVMHKVGWYGGAGIAIAHKTKKRAPQVNLQVVFGTVEYQSQGNSTTFNGTITYVSRQQYITPSFSVMIPVYGTQNIRTYLGTGANFHLVRYTSHSQDLKGDNIALHYKDPFNVRKHWLSADLCLAIRLLNRVEIRGSYCFTGSSVEESQITISPRNINAGLSYYF